MNWKTKTINKREVLIHDDFQIIPCKNGRCQLREAGKLRGTFTDAATAKAQVAFLLEQRVPKPAPATPMPRPSAPPCPAFRHVTLPGRI